MSHNTFSNGTCPDKSMQDYVHSYNDTRAAFYLIIQTHTSWANMPHCPHTVTGKSLTLDFLLLKWKIPRRPFFPALSKLVVLERTDSKKRVKQQQEGKGNVGIL